LNCLIIASSTKQQTIKRSNEITEKLNKGVSTVERYLKILKDNRIIEFQGAPKTGGYVLIK
jgi:ATP-dependent DNA helicase RecG